MHILGIWDVTERDRDLHQVLSILFLYQVTYSRALHVCAMQVRHEKTEVGEISNLRELAKHIPIEEQVTNKATSHINEHYCTHVVGTKCRKFPAWED